MAIEGRAIVCPHLGTGARRCLWAVGSKHAFKHEYAHPLDRYSNKKEAQLAGDHPDLLPRMVDTVDGSLLACQAPYTIEHLIEDLSRSPVHGHVLGLLRCLLSWVQWVVPYAAKKGI